WSCSDLGDPYVEAECPDDQIKDCAGVCGGTAVLDECDICSGDGLTCNVDYSTQIQPIFTSNCNGCHIGGTSGGLNLSVGSSYNNLVNVTSPNYSPALRVNPSSASTSVLWNKIAGGTNGSQMPMNGPYLSQADIDLIETWINEGAQDN
ncbi:MAG TPA: c-type cytochrome, partial [Candidatus Marinimicrobia bacterium]|nr:c-type cytochrome [Candidatus Neomarinimicrobiota bacterium]